MVINILGFARKKYKMVAQSSAIYALKFLGEENLELTIKFVNKKEIQRLNKEFRNIDKVTDVLSFPATDIKAGEKMTEEYLGDMALCLSKAKEQGKEYKNGTVAELRKLVVHSVLHLLGYDHIKDEDYIVMHKKEEEIEKYISNLEK